MYTASTPPPWGPKQIDVQLAVQLADGHSSSFLVHVGGKMTLRIGDKELEHNNYVGSRDQTGGDPWFGFPLSI